MDETIILSTNWGYDYWRKNKPGNFPKIPISYNVPNWKSIMEFCPLPSIGYYFGVCSSSLFDYIIIKNITVLDDNSPQFEYEFISTSKTTSESLDKKINNRKHKIYFSIEKEKLLKSLNELHESPPNKWLALTHKKNINPNWLDYIGSYYQDLIEKDLSSEDFEDKLASLLTALGFEVLQRGHKVKGSYPDGVATYEKDFAIVYDCKNSNNYYPTAEHLRAINQYYADEKRVQGKDKEMFCCLIAKKFTSLLNKECHLIPVESLLYLLQKKFKLGAKFKLDRIRTILVNNKIFSIENINNEWIS